MWTDTRNSRKEVSQQVIVVDSSGTVNNEVYDCFETPCTNINLKEDCG